MIFITVGSTMPFDELLTEVDRLAGAGVLDENVLCQGGQSSYRLTHGEQFVGRPSIDDLIAASSFVISHGGAATVLQLLLASKPFVAFANPRGAGDHQSGFLTAVSRNCPISWSRDVADLERLFRERRAEGPVHFQSDYPRAGTLVRQALHMEDRVTC